MEDLTLLQFITWIIPIFTTAWVSYMFQRYEQYRKHQDEIRQYHEDQIEEAKTNLNTQIELLENALQCILRYKLLQSCRHYIALGSVPLATKIALSNMYRVYIALHGNDVVTEVYHRMLELPETDSDDI